MAEIHRKFNENTTRIWKLAYQMTNSNFTAKITESLDEWEQFIEEVRRTKQEYNNLFPKTNSDLPLVEEQFLGNTKEAKEYINNLYDRLMSLNIQMKTKENTEKGQIEFLKQNMIALTTIEKYEYCEMSMKEIERKSQKKRKEKPDSRTNEIREEEKNWEVLEIYQNDFLTLLDEKIKLTPKLEESRQNIYLSKENLDSYFRNLVGQINEHKDKTMKRQSNVNTLENWEDLQLFAKITLDDYTWCSEYINREYHETNPLTNSYLEFLVKILIQAKQKEVTEENLPEIMQHIETYCISNELNERMANLETLANNSLVINSNAENIETIEAINCFGNKYQIRKTDVETFNTSNKQLEELYPAILEAMNYFEGPKEEETPKL